MPNVRRRSRFLTRSKYDLYSGYIIIKNTSGTIVTCFMSFSANCALMVADAQVATLSSKCYTINIDHVDIIILVLCCTYRLK